MTRKYPRILTFIVAMVMVAVGFSVANLSIGDVEAGTAAPVLLGVAMLIVLVSVGLALRK